MNTFMTDDGVRLAYRIDGMAGIPPLLFINSLGTDLQMWEPQAARFRHDFQVIRCDTRGHGHSDAPPGPYTIERLGRDVLTLLDQLSIEQAHICGLSLGGLTALWLAVYHGERLRSAIFANTAARIGTLEGWSERIKAVRAGGMPAVREMVLGRFFSAVFRQAQPEVVQSIGDMLVAIDPVGYIGACSALRDTDLHAEIPAIRTPSLIVVGALDEATPPAQSEELHTAIRGSKLIVLDKAAHLSNLEQPDAFNSAMLHFLQEQELKSSMTRQGKST